MSRSPYNEWITPNPVVNKDDQSGTPFYDDARKTTYAALFAENVFRFEYFHLVTSARFDHEELSTQESSLRIHCSWMKPTVKTFRCSVSVSAMISVMATKPT